MVRIGMAGKRGAAVVGESNMSRSWAGIFAEKT
jgi:hypothetical protein